MHHIIHAPYFFKYENLGEIIFEIHEKSLKVVRSNKWVLPLKEENTWLLVVVLDIQKNITVYFLLNFVNIISYL